MARRREEEATTGSEASLRPVEAGSAEPEPSPRPDVARRFSWKRAGLHAVITPLALTALVASLQISGAVPRTDAIVSALFEEFPPLLLLGLAASAGYQSRFRFFQYVCVSLLVVPFGLSCGSALTLVQWLRAPKVSTGSQSPTSFQYRSDEHAFTMTLPSSAWHRRSGGQGLAEFWRSGWGVQMLVAVNPVQAMTAKEFEASVAALQSSVRRAQGSDLKTEEGVTAAGARYMFVSVVDGHGNYVAAYQTYLMPRAIAVRLLLEGHQRAASKLGKALEDAFFVSNAHSISQSVASTEVPSTRVNDAAPAPAANPANVVAAGAASAGVAVTQPPRFDWSPGCRVPIIATTKRDADTTKASWAVGVYPGPDGGLEVRTEQVKIVELEGRDVTWPEWQERLKPMAILQSIPYFSVSSQGRYVKTEGLDAMMDRISRLKTLDEAQAQMVGGITASKTFRIALEGAAASLWTAWAEAWLDWRLRPGETRETRVVRVLASGDRVPVLVRERFVGVDGLFAIFERTESIDQQTGAKLMNFVVHDLAAAAGRSDVPDKLLRASRMQTVYYVETRRDVLRPRRTRYESHVESTLADGSTSKQDQVYAQEWDWGHSEGCRD